MSESKVLREIYTPKKEEVKWGCRTLQSDELYLPHIVD
jgi:hypothetical protein